MLLALAAQENVPAAVIGKTGGNSFLVTVDGRELINLPIEKMKTAWREAIGCLLK